MERVFLFRKDTENLIIRATSEDEAWEKLKKKLSEKFEIFNISDWTLMGTQG